MRTGPQQKGSKTEAPGGHRSPNQPETAPVVQRGKAVSPTQSRTRNHPATAPTPKKGIGKALPTSYFANSRTPVHPHFNRHQHISHEGQD